MIITVVQMSYLVGGRFVSLSVKANGKDYLLFVDGVPADVFPSAQAAVAAGMEFVENHLDEVEDL